jgi:putative N-acetylmannosamine-6-phosphate epimerase
VQEDILGPLRELPAEKEMTICAICGRPVPRHEVRLVPTEELISAPVGSAFQEICLDCDWRRRHPEELLTPEPAPDEPLP